MAETKTTTILQASNGVRALFCNYGEPNIAIKDGLYLWLGGSWPLEEFDELAEFVREHQENLKQAEMQTED